MNKQIRIFKYIAAVAAVAVLALGLQTETGYAVIAHIRDMFEPEKEVEQAIEGIHEDTTLELETGQESEYVIYVDAERYNLVAGDSVDRIVPKEPLGDAYPEVAMEIEQVADSKPEELAGGLESDLKNEFAFVMPAERVDHPVQGWKLYAEAGSEWNSSVVRVYVTSNNNAGSFVITQRYFLEAAEGHGARFNEMLEEFTVINHASN